MLRELAELGMALARAVAQQALIDLSGGPTEATPSTTPAAAATPRARPDPGLLFARLSRAVRQTIALEARIAAGDIGPARQRPPSEVPAKPWRTVIGRVLHDAADAEPDAAAAGDLHREINERLADLSELDGDDDRTVDDIVTDICNDIGITPDLGALPDEVLALTARDTASSIHGIPGFWRSYLSPPRRRGPDPP